MLIVTFAYAHNNQSDALRFKDIVHKILKNKRYYSSDISLISQPIPILKSGPMVKNEEDGNMVLYVANNYFYHCVMVQFCYCNKESDDPSKSFIEMNYIGNRNEHEVICDNYCGSLDAILSKSDHSVMTKINKAYDEFEPTELDKYMPLCLQTTRLYFPLKVKATDKKPRMIDWLKELENRIPEGDPLYEQFHEFKNKALAYRKEKIEDIFTGRNEQLVNDYSWLKNLPDPNDSDGDFPNIKGLKDLLDDITKYTFSWAKTGIKDIDDNMVKVGTYVSTCKSIIEGKSSLHEIELKCACPKCKEDIVVTPYYKEKKPIEKDDRLQTFTIPNCGTCNFKENILIINRLKDKLNEVSSDIFQLENNKDNLTMSEIRRYESKIQNGVDYCKNLINQIIHMTGSKDKEEKIVDNTVKQINELKHRLRILPDPRYLPNVKYATRLIDDLEYLLINKDSVKEDKEKHTYSISSDTLYKAVLKIRAIRDSFSKPGMWVDSQTSCWIHTNKDYETLKVLKTYLECEAKKYVNHPACIIETDMMNHMINLIDDALNLYAVDPE